MRARSQGRLPRDVRLFGAQTPQLLCAAPLICLFPGLLLCALLGLLRCLYLGLLLCLFLGLLLCLLHGEGREHGPRVELIKRFGNTRAWNRGRLGRNGYIHDTMIEMTR